MRYFTLAIREEGVWAPQFGDYQRSTVKDEMGEYSDHDVKSCDMKIVVSEDDQASIDAAIRELNNNG